jgi:fucose permease
VLQTSAGIAAIAFVVYMASMTLGRLANDRWIDRFGGVRVVRAGALIGAAGVGAVIAAGLLDAAPLAFAGFAAIGVGSSPMFPVVIGAAGTRPGIPAGHGVALTSWLMRLGFIFVPAIVGIAADAVGLGAAFLIPLAAAFGIAALAVPLTGGWSHRTTITPAVVAR